MALTPLHPAPPRHFRLQTTNQRRAVLASVDAAERETLASEPAALTPDPYLLDTSDNTATENQCKPWSAQQRLIKDANEFLACGFGTCALSPECTRRCRYRQAQQDLDAYTAERAHARLHAIEHLLKESIPDREPMPQVDHKLRRTVWIGITAYALWLVALAAWYFTS